MRWNESEYGNIKDIRVPPSSLWKPDILMYNRYCTKLPFIFGTRCKSIFHSASEAFDGTYQTNVVVTSDGKCSYIPPGIFKSSCQIDITWFPFDDQDCEMKFGSWTYNGFNVSMHNPFLRVCLVCLVLVLNNTYCFVVRVVLKCPAFATDALA